MNIYVLINSRKIRNKVKSNLSYLKIALKDIKNEKKISSIIVNDIKIDFTISVISKSMNTNKSVSAKEWIEAFGEEFAMSGVEGTTLGGHVHACIINCDIK